MAAADGDPAEWDVQLSIQSAKPPGVHCQPTTFGEFFLISVFGLRSVCYDLFICQIRFLRVRVGIGPLGRGFLPGSNACRPLPGHGRPVRLLRRL